MKRKNGFSLIELLVVIAIIGVLIAFLVPNLVGSRDKAKEAAVKSIMHSAQLAVEAYNLENSVYPLGTNLTLKSLFDNYLSVGGYMAEIPKNPFTDKAYTDSDNAGKIIYIYDSSKDKYTLAGYKKNGITTVLELSNM